ncbi:MAG: bifunctional DNA-formamidopyrimidine glycosylase/DNA-(apurinic or apyrimidinic site) lyase [Candidatus Omnitrophota bacterium]
MPELPEVTTIVNQLNKEILLTNIKKVTVTDKRLIKDVEPNEFIKKVTGSTIKEVLRRGKVIIIKLEDKLFLIFHLRISGWLLLHSEYQKSARVSFELSNNLKLSFCDQRVLGEIRLVEDWHNLHIIKSMGPEPLSLSGEKFIELFKGKKLKIKPLLMDQTFIAGIGNLYAQELLFCAKINPEKRADSLTKDQLEKLYSCLINILKDAIEKKGSSVDTYRQVSGSKGAYAEVLKVYQREKEPCCRCNHPIVRKTIAGRGTYFCPECQK